MADMLKDGMAWLAGQLQAGASQEAIIRDGEQMVTVTATFGSSLLKVTDISGRVKIERTARDFIFPSAQLDFGGGPVIPRRGMTAEVPSTGERFEVTAPGNEPCYRHLDPWKTMLRVHSKFIGVT